MLRFIKRVIIQSTHWHHRY